MKKIISKMKKEYPRGSSVVLKSAKRRTAACQRRPSNPYHCELYESVVVAMKKWIADAIGEPV